MAARTERPGVLCERALLALTGSPAVLAMPQYILVLRSALVGDLRVIMTAAATRFLPASSVRLFAGGAVRTDVDEVVDGVLVPHVELTDGIDLLLVMPATANIIGKAAHGICDDLVSTAIVASPAPVVLVPAMNERMWRSAVVERNVGLAREAGYHVIEPGVGFQLADAREATGTMPPLEHILDQLMGVVAGERVA
jgi:phosphopantothenoylcysteine decarboxylase/phosphopantothenate--cysteine ligase